MKKDTYYFTHDYNTRNDQKIKKLIAKHGYLGYGLFWALIEELYNNANALHLDYDTIAFDLRADSDTIKCIINDYDLFAIKDGFFGSLSVEKRLNDRLSKSTKARESALLRWTKSESNANALPSDSDSNAIKEKKVKEKEINIINYDQLLEFFNKVTGKKCRVVEEKAKRGFNSILKAGYTTKDIANAIRNCFNDEFHQKNPKYLTLEFISRIDKFQKYVELEANKSILPNDYMKRYLSEDQQKLLTKKEYSDWITNIKIMETEGIKPMPIFK
jgi:hypothetical protein